jgi:MoaA/NifB/PqqE/SkfB family radical SAM enzyme
MKLISVFSPSHEILKNDWFLRTLKDDYDVRIHRCDVQGDGKYMQEDWTKTVLFKSTKIIDAIQENWGDVFMYSDVDVTFFAPTKTAVLESLADKDIVCQLDDPVGNLCTGFFAVRANAATLKLWRDVRKAVERERRDQIAFNRLVREYKIRAGYLPASFFGPGTFTGRLFQGTERIYVPSDPIMFHANWVIGVNDKIKLLAQAHRIVGRSECRRAVNNFFFAVKRGNRLPNAVQQLICAGGIPPLAKSRVSQSLDAPMFSRPRSVALDLSTACQLKCPSCPTATGAIAKTLGAGFLTLEHFKKFLRDQPWVSDMELSNWGEAFLNPDFEEILRHAYERRVSVHIENGANLDRVSAQALESVVKYRLRSLTCSIDGASHEVYSAYRVKGDLDRVLGNIRQINSFKKRYNSPYPALRWQFVAFGHNTHEIDKARGMARDLGMTFSLKLSWDDLYGNLFSPVVDRELVRKESELGVADRAEYEEKFGRSYIARSCHQLWLRPRINFDGRLLGCSINHWDDFGNVFRDGLEACLNSEKMQRTKRMLMGLSEADDGSPCLRCQVYVSMSQKNSWVRSEDLMPQSGYRWLTTSPKLASIVWRFSEIVSRVKRRHT